MYINIKNPERTYTLRGLVICGIISFLMLAVLIHCIRITENLFDLLDQIGTFFSANGHIAVFLLLVILAIPLLFVYYSYKWFKQRPYWHRADCITALEFTTEGVILYTPAQRIFLPYQETCLSVTAHLFTIRNKNSRRAAMQKVTLDFQQDTSKFSVQHLTGSVDTLCQLVDFQSYFKEMDFQFDSSSKLEDEFAKFLQEQIDNQRLYGVHYHYQHPILMTLLGLFLTIVLAIIIVSFFRVSTGDSSFFLFIIPLLVPFSIGIWLLRNAYRDIRVYFKLKHFKHRL